MSERGFKQRQDISGSMGEIAPVVIIILYINATTQLFDTC